MTRDSAIRRIVATMSVLLAVSAAFAAGLLVAGGRDGADRGYRLTAAGLDSGLSCDRLRQWYVDHGVDQVTAWGWNSASYRVPPMLESGAGQAAGSVDGSAGAPAGAPLDTHTGSVTGTNVQEAGVDEPDIAKTSGDLLVRISDGTLKTDDVGGASPRRLGVAPLDPIEDPQLLLAGDRALVIGGAVGDPSVGAPFGAPHPRTWVRAYDLSDPRDPTLVDSRLYDGSLVSARQVGTTVRLVLGAGLPALDFETPSSTVDEKAALEHNRQLVRDSTIDDWLPRVTTFDGAASSSATLVRCDKVAVPETFNGLGTLAVVGFDPSSSGDVDATAVATASDTAYMSPAHLYVATSPWRLFGHPGPMVMPGGLEPTRIYGFDLSGTAARYVGMGTVDGTVAGSWSMDEHDGVLRVAASTPLGSTSVVLLRPESGRLLDVGRVDDLGVGQQLKSVRWFDDLAVLVTFEQTDPFYVVDLTDANHPQVLGALHLPGWSSYLHPVGPHLVLGIGQTSPQEVFEPPVPMPTMSPMPVPPKSVSPQRGPDGSGGLTASPLPVDPTGSVAPVLQQRAKATLFDISDLAHPRDVDTVAYPAGSLPMAATNPHQVTWLPEQNTLLTVIGSGSGASTYAGARAWVSVLKVTDGSLENRLLPVPATSAVDDIRTLPLADARVALVAGDSVQLIAV